MHEQYLDGRGACTPKFVNVISQEQGDIRLSNWYHRWIPVALNPSLRSEVTFPENPVNSINWKNEFNLIPQLHLVQIPWPWPQDQLFWKSTRIFKTQVHLLGGWGITLGAASTFIFAISISLLSPSLFWCFTVHTPVLFFLVLLLLLIDSVFSLTLLIFFYVLNVFYFPYLSFFPIFHVTHLSSCY